MKTFVQNTKLKLCQTALVSLLFVLSPLASAQESDLPPGIASKKLDPKDYSPGQLIVKLKEGKTTADLQELNSKYKVSSVEKVFKDSAKPEDVLTGLKADLAKLNAGHQSWYWQLDKDSKEYKDYQQKIENEKEEIQAKIKRQEELISRLEKRQARAAGGQKGSSNLENIYLLKIQGGDSDMSGMIEDYKESPAVEYAEPNYIARVNVVPNDTKYSQQWAHQNTQAESGWDITVGGSNVIIAIIDSGVDYNHEDLKDNIWKDADGNPGKDFVEVDTSQALPEGYAWISAEDYTGVDYAPSDYLGHGTHVAGIAAAKGNNSLGVAGVCYDCKIMPLRAGFAIEYKGATYSGLEGDDIANAITYAADNGADVINMSFGGSYSETEKEAIDYAYSKGVILVAAAGNGNSEDTDKNNKDVQSYPAALDNVIAVAATDKDDTLASYSNYGDWVDVSAPGGDGDNGIISTVSTSALWGDSSGYAGSSWQGTSMASPYVAGLAGLIINQYSEYTQSEIKAKIASSSDSIDSLNSGYSGKLGSGRVNVYNSLLADKNPSFELASVEMAESSGDGDGIVEYGEEASLTVEIKNAGGDAYSVSASLSSDSQDVDISVSSYEYGTVKENGSGNNSSSPFKFKAGSSFSGEKIVEFSLSLEALGDYSQTLTTKARLGIKKLNSNSGKGALEKSAPAIDENKVIWSYKTADNYDLYKYDLKTGQENKLSFSSSGAADRKFPDLSGSKAVFYDSRDTESSYKYKWPLYSYDLDSQEETNVSGETETSKRYLSISGNNIVWLEDVDGDLSRVYLYNLDDKEKKEISPDEAYPDSPAISGSKIVWQDSRSDSGIYLYNLNDGKESKISPDAANSPYQPRISANRVVYLDRRAGHTDVYLYDIDAQEEKRITTDEAQPWYCAISGKKIVYLDDRNGNSDVYLYDLSKEEETRLTLSESADQGVNISGNKIVWIREDETDTFNVYVTEVAADADTESVDSTSPSAPEVTDEGQYTVNTDKLSAQWSSSDSESAISEYQYALGTSSGGTDVLGWTSVGTDTSVTKTGLSLSDGTIYYFSVKAKNEAGLWSEAGYSDGITVDGAAPSTKLTGVDSDSWSKSPVTITLTSSDSVSGVDKTYYSTDGSDPSVVYSGPFTLSDEGTYTLKYYSIDKAGNSESVNSAQYQVKIDSTAPSTAVSGFEDRADWNTQEVTITLAATDSGSGVDKTYYSTDGSDPANEYSSAITLSSDGAYTIKYYSVDKAGNSEEVKTTDYQVKIDQTSPTGSITINNGDGYTSFTSVTLEFSLSDAASGMGEGAKMMFSNDNSSWSAEEDYAESRIWKMPLGSGKKTIYVKFMDVAGNWSSVYSDTIVLDQSAPEKPKVKDGKEHSRSHNKLSCSWSSSDKESGIVEYQYSIGTAKGKTNVLGWTSAGTDTSVTVTGLKLKTGKTYYFNVKAQNGAGLISQAGHSNGIKIKKKK